MRGDGYVNANIGVGDDDINLVSVGGMADDGTKDRRINR